MVGIYKITNNINNKCYIGQSVNLKVRFNKHKRLLRNNIHDNSHLQNAVNKYGFENFTIEIICECEEYELDELERAFIKKYKSCDPKFGYNRETGGSSNKHPTKETLKKLSDSHKGYKLTEEQKRKIGLKSLGRKHTEESKIKLSRARGGESIVQLTLDGKYVNRFKSVAIASKKTGIIETCIRPCLRGICKKSKGFIWILEKDYNQNKDYALPDKRIVQLTLNGAFVKVYDNVPSAYKEIGIKTANIHQCLRKGLGYSAGNYLWLYFKNYNSSKKYKYKFQIKNAKKVIQLNLKGKYISTFNNAIEAKKYLGVTNDGIYSCLNHKRISYKKFLWIYEDEYNPKVDYSKLIKNRMIKIGQYSLDNNLIKVYNSIQEATNETKIRHISGCARGKRKTAGGYIWKIIH